MDLTFQVSMQYCSLQHWTLLSPPDTSTAEHFCFGSASSFWSYFSALSWKQVGHLLTWEAHHPVQYFFAFSFCSWGSWGKNTEVFCHSLLQWTRFCQNSAPWSVHLMWPCMAWLTASLSYIRLWSMWSFWLERVTLYVNSLWNTIYIYTPFCFSIGEI